MARANSKGSRFQRELIFNIRIERLVLSQLSGASKGMQALVPIVPKVPGDEEKLMDDSSGPPQG